MKLVGKILLGISLLLSFWVLLISISARFQLLDSNFWIKSFRDGNVYSKIDDPLAKETEKAFIAEGASVKEAKQVSAFFESKNLQNFTEKNIVNILEYVNGRANELTIFFPLYQIPVDIRDDLGITSDQISINKLISTFGQESTPAGVELFLQLRTLGNMMTISLIVAIISLLIHVFLLYKLEARGERLKALGVSFIISGILSLILVVLINVQIKNMSTDLTLPDREAVQIMLGTLAPPVIKNITNLWTILSVISIIVGVACLFIKRRGTSISPIKNSPGKA